MGGKPRLAWDIYAEGGESSYTVLVDAESGDTLVRKDLTEHVGGARYFPRDPDTSPITQITMPPSWYDQNNGGTRLWGQYSRTYIDPNDQDPAPGSEEGGTRRQIPESSPGSRDWLYTRTTFPGATPCPVGGCAWDSTIAASRDHQPVPGGDERPRARRPLLGVSRPAADRLRRGVGQLPARQRERCRTRQRLHPQRGQRRPGFQQRQLRDAVRRQRAPHADVPVHGPQRERQRRGRRRLPRDRSRPLEPADRQRLRQSARSMRSRGR